MRVTDSIMRLRAVAVAVCSDGRVDFLEEDVWLWMVLPWNGVGWAGVSVCVCTGELFNAFGWLHVCGIEAWNACICLVMVQCCP